MKNARCKMQTHNAKCKIRNCSCSANIHLPLWGRGTAAFAVVDEVFPLPLSLGKQNGQSRTPVTKPSSERKVAFSLENDGRSLR